MGGRTAVLYNTKLTDAPGSVQYGQSGKEKKAFDFSFVSSSLIVLTLK